MASSCPPESFKDHMLEEEEFQQILNRIGGKGKICLVVDTCKKDDNDASGRTTLQEFIVDMFQNGLTDISEPVTDNSKAGYGGNDVMDSLNCITKTGDQIQSFEQDRTPRHVEGKCLELSPIQDGKGKGRGRSKEEVNRTIRSSMNVGGKERAIDSALVIFIFKHEYVSCKRNHVCVKEILKDVRARIKRTGARPALLGLIHSDAENTETGESVGILEHFLRSVFQMQPPESIWVGLYIPRIADRMLTIKRETCKVVNFSLSTVFTRASQKTTGK
ncbi:uncharacterized protein LOC115828002 isoform X2 [Chanos chanos]|uniref:Uncharacterized protein LOC115828002 isoform X2 n=1 Tax=Chanos chanos TaxID=29144 RepID=A0A6J2WU81_CHACN|nr:uncharacterized protein LOC115828002 isoform X2 [Chanos chanos]